jgi:hypothetical protein
MCVQSSSSTGSRASIPIITLPDGRAFWLGQQHCNPVSGSEKSLSHSAKSELANFKSLQHGPRISSDVEDQQSLYPTYPVSISSSNLSPMSPSLPVKGPSLGIQNPTCDIESQKYEAILHERKTPPQLQRYVKIISMVVGFLVLLAMVLILSFHTSKTMARAGFTACTTVAFFCVAAGMWAADRTMVETFIAMNIVIVYGIFLNAQIDVFLNYS